MKNRKQARNSIFLYLMLPIILGACNGPRNMYSVSPLIAPVPLQKGSGSIELTNFTHSKKSEARDTAARDYGFGLNLSHMLNDRIMILGFLDIKKEKNQNHGGWGNAFDSSAIAGKRYAAGLGITYFFDRTEKLTPSIALSAGLHHMSINESGTLQAIPYHRFYKMYQLSISAQGNILFRITEKLNLAYSARLTAVKFFHANTDFSTEEKYNTGLHLDGKMQVYCCLLGLYADYQPLKNFPLSVTGQVFTDYIGWARMMARYEPGRT